ncbi:hypothetical protein [Flavobacterium sp.]|jgi:hypothetical protein|uniref:hypothetical protein n=1 Tax=Flavobacterium sp. TaxID=239 RepID=UPI00334091CF
MKRLLLFTVTLCNLAVCKAQEQENPEFIGENFSLEGALALFQKSQSIEAFEQALNAEDNGVNNLDLNLDGQVDYITVTDFQEGDTHALVLSIYLSDQEKQDVAVIGIEKTGPESAQLQIEGDEALYATNTIVEPQEVSETIKSKGPNGMHYDAKAIGVNVWLWPVVRFMYSPGYVVWRSPWRWRVYPQGWRPWRVVSYSVFTTRFAPHRLVYRRVPTRTVVVAHRVYRPNRRHTTAVVNNRRGTRVVRSTTPRGTTVIRKNRTQTGRRR